MRSHTYRQIHLWIAFLFCLCASITSASVNPCLSHDALCQKITTLTTDHSDLVQASALAQSKGGKTVWLIQMAASSDTPVNHRPAMLVVAGAEANDWTSTPMVLHWIETLIASSEIDPNVADLLETHTLYVVPSLYVQTDNSDPNVLWESTVDEQPVDNDHDDVLDEDGPDDLNQDGLITWMRIKDKAGPYILDAQDDRLLVEADPLKGETGQWRYMTEGLDNDQDDQWNEDGPGGINLNRNFPFNYDFFAPDSGLHPMSEPQTRALADFVIEHPEIGLVVTYGMADNLLKKPDSESPPRRGLPMKAIDKADLDWYQALGERYRDTMGLKKELITRKQPGTFSDWMYFHRGRLSVAAMPWSPELAVALYPLDKKGKDPNDPNQPEKKKPGKRDDKRNQEERSWLAWYDQHDPNAFVPWQTIDHPDFPNHTVQVGGYRPYALTNPPSDLVEDLTQKQAAFLTECMGLLPHIAVRNIKVKHLGDSVFDLKLEVENTGFLPTSLAQGQRTREVYPTRVILDVSEDALLTGSRIQSLGTLNGSGGMAKAHWIIHCPDQTELTVTIVSMLAGRLEQTVTLTR